MPGSPFAFMQLINDVDTIVSKYPNSPLCTHQYHFHVYLLDLGVHCSAGIGRFVCFQFDLGANCCRTGTFFSVHILMHTLRQSLDAKISPEINVIETVLKLREQRAGMVQTKVLPIP